LPAWRVPILQHRRSDCRTWLFQLRRRLYPQAILAGCSGAQSTRDAGSLLRTSVQCLAMTAFPAAERAAVPCGGFYGATCGGAKRAERVRVVFTRGSAISLLR